MPGFVKGQSGNPGGRPSGFGEIRQIARSHTEEAILTLLTIMRSAKAPANARVAAANAILDRGWGKPTTTMNVRRDTAEDEPDIATTTYYEAVEYNAKGTKE